MQTYSQAIEKRVPAAPMVRDAPPATQVSPQRLLRLFAILSLAAVAVILVLAGSGIHRIYSHEMLKVAEETAVYVGNSIFEQERATLLHADGAGVKVAVSPDEFAALDERMKTFLRTFNMYKIKAFSLDRSIIYSTDEKIIGKVEGRNPKLDSVLGEGSVVSALELKDKVRDLKGEDRFKVDVVETYVPIRVGSSIVGAFEVYTDISSTRDRVWTAMLNTLALLAVVLAGVFGALYLTMRTGMARLKKAEDRLHELASVDTLTGIFNRRHVLDRVSEERERMRRHQPPSSIKCLSLLMIDIDHFKKVNDTHGHLAGDAVLQEVTARLKATLRRYDVIGRYGGEEFLVVLPSTALDEAQLVAERLRAAVCAGPIRCTEAELVVSVSVGVSSALNAEEQITPMLARADESLYRAKGSGRNRVCCVQALEQAAAAMQAGASS